MKRKEIKQHLQRAVREQTPEILDEILLRAQEIQSTDDGTAPILPLPRKKKRTMWVRTLAAAAMIAVVLLGSYWGYSSYTAVDCVVDIDVNPSITLQLNRREQVVSVAAGNADAQQVLEGMDFKRVDLHVAINAIIGSMVRHGYIDAIQNSVLISVEYADAQKGDQLQRRMLQEVSSILEGYKLNGAVLSQAVSEDTRLQALAEQYGISLGKAALIEQVIAGNAKWKFEDLVSLKINELNLLLAQEPTQQQGQQQSGQQQGEQQQIHQHGHASTQGYVGENAAIQAALKAAGLTRGKVLQLEVELDYNNNQMVYEVEFCTKLMEYDYEINATTGAVTKAEQKALTADRDDNDDDDDDDDENGGNGHASHGGSASGAQHHGEKASDKQNNIGQQKARNIALNALGVKQADVTKLEEELDTDDDAAIYEVSFIYQGREHSFEIDASSGKILEHEVD